MSVDRRFRTIAFGFYRSYQPRAHGHTVPAV